MQEFMGMTMAGLLFATVYIKGKRVFQAGRQADRQTGDRRGLQTRHRTSRCFTPRNGSLPTNSSVWWRALESEFVDLRAPAATHPAGCFCKYLWALSLSASVNKRGAASRKLSCLLFEHVITFLAKTMKMSHSRRLTDTSGRYSAQGNGEDN